jgi:hypothetical protein
VACAVHVHGKLVDLCCACAWETRGCACALEIREAVCMHMAVHLHKGALGKPVTQVYKPQNISSSESSEPHSLNQTTTTQLSETRG